MSDLGRRELRVANAAYRSLGPVVDVGTATLLLCPEAPGSPMLNRVVGLGTDSPATEGELDAVLAAVPPGTTYYVAVEPDASPDALPAWLAARGLEPGWGWMRFRRGIDLPPARPTTLTLARAETPAQIDAFAHIVCTAYGLPGGSAALLHRATGTPWELWLALDGDRPVGAAGLYVEDGTGYLGLAGTLAESRGKGAQTLLLRHRIARAAERGCDVVVSETGERRGDLPSNSYRNLVRAGFEETTVVANWLGRA